MDELESSILLLEENHGTFADGGLRNRSSTFHVNKIFMEDGRGKMIKSSIKQTIDQVLEGSKNIQIVLSTDELPLKLKEREGKTWEEYFFQDMPAAIHRFHIL